MILIKSRFVLVIISGPIIRKHLVENASFLSYKSRLVSYEKYGRAFNRKMKWITENVIFAVDDSKFDFC